MQPDIRHKSHSTFTQLWRTAASERGLHHLVFATQRRTHWSKLSIRFVSSSFSDQVSHAYARTERTLNAQLYREVYFAETAAFCEMTGTFSRQSTRILASTLAWLFSWIVETRNWSGAIIPNFRGWCGYNVMGLAELCFSCVYLQTNRNGFTSNPLTNHLHSYKFLSQNKIAVDDFRTSGPNNRGQFVIHGTTARRTIQSMAYW